MGSNGQLSGQFGNYAFLEFLGGLIPRVYLANDNRDDGNNITDLNAWRSSTGSPNLPPSPKRTDDRSRQPRKKKLSPAKILHDLKLPPDHFKHFIDLLEQVGYELTEDKVPSNYEDREYNYVSKKNAPKQQENARCLIYIPREIFKNEENSELIKAVFYDFSISKPGSFIIVFSNLKEDVPERSFRDIIEQKSPTGYPTALKGSYVPWKDIQRLGLNSSTEEWKKNLLASILEIPRTF